MSILRLAFAGQVKKAEHRTVGDKSVIDLSLCRKNYAKQGEEATFTWIRVSVWGAPDWMAAKAIKGAFVAGTGDLTLRSYVDKQGAKGVSAEVRCTSFDLDIAGDEAPAAEPAPAKAAPPRKPAPPVAEDDDSSPPF